MTNSGIITIDFRNTLAICDEWFAIEVRELVSRYLKWWAQHGGPVVDDHTLAAADLAYRRLRKGIHQHGHELPAERCIAMVLEGLGYSPSQQDLDLGARAIMEATLPPSRPTPGAVEFVRELAEAGERLAVISSAVYHPFLEWSLEKFDILDCFDLIVTSASSGYYKSRPEIYTMTLDALNASPAKSLHLGDSKQFDVRTARRAGMQTVWLQRDSAEPAPPEATLVISSLEQSAPLLLELQRLPASRT